MTHFEEQLEDIKRFWGPVRLFRTNNSLSTAIYVLNSAYVFLRYDHAEQCWYYWLETPMERKNWKDMFCHIMTSTVVDYHSFLNESSDVYEIARIIYYMIQFEKEHKEYV